MNETEFCEVCEEEMNDGDVKQCAGCGRGLCHLHFKGGQFEEQAKRLSVCLRCTRKKAEPQCPIT